METIPQVGLRMVVKRKTDPPRKQNRDTNKNWTKVKVTGYRN